VSVLSVSAAEEARLTCRYAAVLEATSVPGRGGSIDRPGYDVDRRPVDGRQRLCPALPLRRRPRQSDWADDRIFAAV